MGQESGSARRRLVGNKGKSDVTLFDEQKDFGSPLKCGEAIGGLNKETNMI